MTLDELHDILYEILKTIDDACKAEGVSYQIGGGTLLGAVRHHDFIPWDDDADIVLWRSEYPAFKKAMEKHLPSYYRLQEPVDLAPNFYDFVVRIQDLRYHWHEPDEIDKAYDNRQNFINVDVFFFDFAGDTPLAHSIFAFRQKMLYGLAMGHRVKYDYSKYSFAQKLEVSLLAGIGRLIPVKTICARQEKLSAKYAGKRTKYCMVTNDLMKYIDLKYETEWCYDTVDIQFRDRMLPAHKGYHEKMTMQYGDYMTPRKDSNEFIQHLTEE